MRHVFPLRTCLSSTGSPELPVAGCWGRGRGGLWNPVHAPPPQILQISQSLFHVPEATPVQQRPPLGIRHLPEAQPPGTRDSPQLLKVTSAELPGTQRGYRSWCVGHSLFLHGQEEDTGRLGGCRPRRRQGLLHAWWEGCRGHSHFPVPYHSCV